MTAGSTDVLVLGLGNLLLSDDGLGLRLLKALAARGCAPPNFWTAALGLALLAYLADRRALIILDAVRSGVAAGTVHVLPLMPSPPITPLPPTGATRWNCSPPPACSGDLPPFRHHHRH